MKQLKNQNLCCKKDCHRLIEINVITKLHTDVNYLFEIILLRSNLTLFYQSQLFPTKVNTLVVLLPERTIRDTWWKR